MPYSTYDELPAQLKAIKPPISVEQANDIAKVADRLEEEGDVDEPWAVAISQFKKQHEAAGGKWVKKDGVEKGTRGDQEQLDIKAPIVKADFEKRLVYGVVLVPDRLDGEQDIIDAEEIEKAAHAWMLRGLTVTPNLMDNQHEEVVSVAKARPVESYIAPVDFTIGDSFIAKGSWVLVTHIPDDDLWELVKAGKRRAYSIAGWGKRSEVDY